MDQIKGAQSIMFREAPYLISAASVAGSKEADGPIGKLFDVTDKDDLFGAQTWEEAESNMQKEACVLAAGKAHVDLKKIRYLFGGDLLRQGIATSMGVEALQIPMFGLYGACSTSGEALALASMSAAAGYGGTMIAVTSSHFGSAEKEFRFPLGYANQRPLSSHWTVTGSGAFLVQSAEEYRKQNTKSYFSNIRVTKVVKGGRNFRFTALVVVGDGNGHVGAGLGKATEIPEAIRKGKEDAMKKMIEITFDENGSITHDVLGKFGSASVLLKKAPDGTGVIAGGPARAVIEMAGIKNIRTKSLGSNNKQNVVLATIEGLKDVKSPEDVARLRGKSIEEIMG